MYKQEGILRGGLKMLLTIGAGTTFGNQWLCIPFAGDKTHFKEFPIVWCELYIVVVMLKTWCHNLTNNRISLHIDNQIIVHAINNGVCKNDDIMELIRELYSILFQNNMECHCIYIESSHNVIADVLSKLDFNTFWNFKPMPLLT